MKRMNIVKLFGAAALAVTLAACGGGSGEAAAPAEEEATEEAAATETDYSFFAGQWRGSVEVTGETVYVTAGGNEQMLDVVFADDGTVEVTPLEAHADLLTDSGTYDGTESEVTLHLSSWDITLTTVDNATMSGNAADFGIADFETINFDFYG
ncbi:MAG: hypothetical protein IJM67_08650 [Atopobiaceae bacterium]|nr:hypothetical protein [Atopobiaceae bacterium]